MEGGSEGSDVGAGEAGVDACDTLEALRVASDDADELVASRRYSTTSQVCRVASGAKETRRLAIALLVTDAVSLAYVATYRVTCAGRRVASFRPRHSMKG